MQSTRHRRGSLMVYAVFALATLLAFATLSVDWGRVELAKTELQQAADGAARYAAAGLPLGVAAVQARAATVVADNKADGTPITFNSTTDVEFGLWNQTTHVFSALSGTDRTSANAVRVTTSRDATHGSPISLVFGKAINRSTIDVHASSVVARGRPFTPAVAGGACPWLAGMPSTASVPATADNPQATYASANAPTAVSGISLVAGSTLVFRQASGQTSYSNASNYGPDGNTDWIVQQSAVNGINTTQAPLNCLVGIFLDDRAPNTYGLSTAGNFSTAASRDFSSLSPPLKQVFFIGDGVNSASQLQQFVVPPGATRFYLGIMDEKGWWWDNTGTLTTTMMDDHITTVK